MVIIWTLASALLFAVAGALVAPAVSDIVSVIKIALGMGRPRRGRSGGWGGDPATGPDGGPPAADPAARPFLLFLVPAHDEELLIERTAAALLAVRYLGDRRRIVVVADNCTDRTADLARGAGLECIERTDPVKRGKPFAIEWALRELGLDGVDAVVIVDADTLIDPGFAEAIASRAPLGSITLQAFNGVSNPEDNSITRMSAVFSSARYDFAFPLKERAGLTVPIQGAGSVIGGEILRTDGWRAFSICEDWELYALYTEMGIHMGVEPRARILAQEARSFAQSRSQRERWAAGKITVFLRHFFPLLRSRAVSLHQKLDVLGELAAPGPAVHLGMGVLILLAALLLPLPGRLWIAVLIVAGLARTATYTKLAIVKDPHPVRAALSFLFLPFYTVWRVAIQILSLRMLGDKPWVRTERHS